MSVASRSAPVPYSPTPAEAPATWLAVVMAGDVFEKAGVGLGADEQAGMTALVAQAAEISARDKDRAETRELTLGSLAAVASILALPVALVVHWNLSALWVLPFLVAQYVGGCLVMVAPLLLLATKGDHDQSFPWKAGAALTVAVEIGLLLAMIAATVHAFSSPMPGTWAALGLGVAVGFAFLPLWLGLSSIGLVVAANVPGIRVRRDPYMALVCGLLEVLFRLRFDTDFQIASRPFPDSHSGPIWPLPLRQQIARPLEQAARTVERDFVHATKPLYPASAVVKAALGDHANRVATWLRARQVEILTPSPVAPADVEVQLARGFAGICLGDWSAVQQEPRPSSRRSRLRRALPRIVSAAGLVTAVALAPEALRGVMEPSAIRTLQVALAVTAAGALVTPQQAVTDAIKNIQDRLAKVP